VHHDGIQAPHGAREVITECRILRLTFFEFGEGEGLLEGIWDEVRMRDWARSESVGRGERLIRR
jgi:hypothetical protein